MTALLNFLTQNPHASVVEERGDCALLKLALPDYTVFEVRRVSRERLQFVGSFTTEEEARRVFAAVSAPMGVVA